MKKLQNLVKHSPIFITQQLVLPSVYHNHQKSFVNKQLLENEDGIASALSFVCAKNCNTKTIETSYDHLFAEMFFSFFYKKIVQ